MTTAVTVDGLQWFCFRRNIGKVTLKVVSFDYLQQTSLDQSIQNRCHLNLKTEAQVRATGPFCNIKPFGSTKTFNLVKIRYRAGRPGPEVFGVQ